MMMTKCHMCTLLAIAIFVTTSVFELICFYSMAIKK